MVRGTSAWNQLRELVVNAAVVIRVTLRYVERTSVHAET
jgi:hypothetical protein